MLRLSDRFMRRPAGCDAEVATKDYDVIIVGAGIAGCVAALLYARHGLRVALIERKENLADYKKLCTHYLQPTAIPLLQQLGLYEAVMAAGAVPSRLILRTPWGQLPAPQFGETHKGLNIRRELLDPLLRETAIAHPSIDWWGGYRLVALRQDRGQIQGVQIQAGQAQPVELDAALVVGADGRQSKVAKLAELATRSVPNERFSFYRYFRQLPPYPGNDTQVWVLDGGSSYVTAFPNDAGLTLVSCYVPESQFEAWQQDVDAAFRAQIARAPNGPNIDQAEPVGDFLGKRKAPTLSRTASIPGLALIGDAAIAIDPLVGIGCTWAMQSAFFLVERTKVALQRHDGRQTGTHSRLNRALRAYRWQHRLYFGALTSALTPFSQAKPYHPVIQWALRGLVK